LRGQGGHGPDDVLLTHHRAKSGLHAPDGDQDLTGNAEARFDWGQSGQVGAAGLTHGDAIVCHYTSDIVSNRLGQFWLAPIKA
jgi:hypothetical protein